MNINPTKAYVYQPFPPKADGKFYGVSGPDSMGFDDGNLRGVSLKDANEIVRFCNKNPEFAASFVTELKRRMDLDGKSFNCGCQFESPLSNAVLICDKCDKEMEGQKS